MKQSQQLAMLGVCGVCGAKAVQQAPDMQTGIGTIKAIECKRCGASYSGWAEDWHGFERECARIGRKGML